MPLIFIDETNENPLTICVFDFRFFVFWIWCVIFLCSSEQKSTLFSEKKCQFLPQTT